MFCPLKLRSVASAVFLCLAGAAVAAVAAVLAAADGQCDLADLDCMANLGTPPAPGDSDEPQRSEDEDGEREIVTKPGAIHLAVLFGMMAQLILWLGFTIKWACDGSLPARMWLWGFLPEAYAAISVKAVVALLRLKQGATPVIMLRNCVTDANAADLAEGCRRYGKKADIQALELPFNPGLGENGLRCLADLAKDSGSSLQEFDFSDNPQLHDSAFKVLVPLVQAKVSKVNCIRLINCGLCVESLSDLTRDAEKTRLQTLDLSWNVLTNGGEALAAILEAPVLSELMLAACKLTADDIRHVAEQLPYTSLKLLHLGGNRFGNNGLSALVEHLPDSRIEELGLEANDIEEEALGDLAAAWAKRPFPRIRLDGNRISKQKLVDFVNTLTTLYK